MEVAPILVPVLLTPIMNVLVPKLLRFIKKGFNLRQDVQQDIESIKAELEMMCSAIEDNINSNGSNDLGAGLKTWIRQVSRLAHKMEDCVDNYVYDQAAGSTAMPNPDQFAAKIKELWRESAELKELREKYKIGATTPVVGVVGDTAGSSTSPSSTHHPPALPSNLVVGKDDYSLSQLLHLVEEEAEGQTKHLKVISILGFDGLGKTVLANRVYRSPQFGETNKAWVNAEDKNARQVLLEIIQQMLPPETRDPSSVEQLCDDLNKHLQNKRYFIVIDDIREEQWSAIESAFPANEGHSSRVVVTTSIQSTAYACCSAEGYLYRLQTLDAGCSKALFFASASVKKPSVDMETGSEQLRKKCDGLPLALVTVGQFTRSQGLTLTGKTCLNVCSNLGRHLEEGGNSALDRMQRVLARSYTSQSGCVAKACLLCIAMFPNDHRIRTKRLIRRWLAEGLFRTEAHHRHSAIGVAVKNFETLINQNVIQPIDVGNNEEVRSCQPPGMMLEFIKQKSKSCCFTTLFCEAATNVLTEHDRRLALHYSKTGNVGSGCDLSLVRSLTIFGKACQEIMDFSRYKLLRVLDLEDCDEMSNDHLKGICKLFLLNYLSFGGFVTELPKEMARLEYLQTLDVRRTNREVTIPIEVVMLTSLFHLFGKFKILGKASKETQKFFESGKSNLKTLAGFVADENQCLLQLMLHMKNLTKVKLWCKSGTNRSNLATALQNYIEDGYDPNAFRSLSIDSDVSFKDMVQFSPVGYFNINSLKLYGDLQELPHFVSSLQITLRELCLSSTSTLRRNILNILTKLKCLVYLKLVAAELDDFVISDETKFQSLQRLCFVVKCPTLPKIEGDPLPQLVSLQLLYNDVEDLPVINIESIKCLREVTLYSSENNASSQEWENAAKRHPNRARVIFIEKEHSRAENFVAPEQPARQKGSKLKGVCNPFQRLFGLKKGGRRCTALVSLDNGHPDCILHETARAHAGTSGSTTAPAADGCTMDATHHV